MSETGPTLLELSQQYAEAPPADLSMEQINVVIEGLFELQKYDVDAAVKMASTLGMIIQDWDIATRIVAPFANLMIDDLGLVRSAAAFIADSASLYFSSGISDEAGALRQDAIVLRDAAAQLFQRLSAVPGQKAEVQELADNMGQKYMNAYGADEEAWEFFAPILPFTTLGQKADAAKLTPAS